MLRTATGVGSPAGIELVHRITRVRSVRAWLMNSERSFGPDKRHIGDATQSRRSLNSVDHCSELLGCDRFAGLEQTGDGSQIDFHIDRPSLDRFGQGFGLNHEPIVSPIGH